MIGDALNFTFALVLSVVVILTPSDSARILGFFPSTTKSHLLIHCAVAETLAQAGHDVIVVGNTPNVYKSSRYKYIQINEFTYELSLPKENKESVYLRLFSVLNQLSQAASLSRPEMQEFLKKHSVGSFDLLILGYYLNDFHLGLAAHYQCPVIVSVPIQTVYPTNLMIGNPQEKSYVPTPFLGFKQPMSFLKSIINVVVIFLENYGLGTIYYYQNQRMYSLHFPADRYASFNTVRKNVSLVFVNHHFSQGPIRPNLPALIEIGGIQIKEEIDSLPQDIAHILNKSENGFIYISFGTKINASTVLPEKSKAMFNVLSKMPYTVLWKWDHPDVPGASSNIHYKIWLPQDDILAHPKVKLFITHGGQGSVVESQYHGVPMVAIPFMSDQPANVKMVVSSEFGLDLDYATLTENKFKATIIEVLNNPKYTAAVQKFSVLYKDRPMTPRQTVVYWANYVLRHKGALHMQSPAVHLNVFELMSLDVLLFLLLVFLVTFYYLKFLLKKGFRILKATLHLLKSYYF